MTRNKTITALVGGALLLTPVAMAPTAVATTSTPAATTTTVTPTSARRTCGATWGKSYSGTWGPRFKCIKLKRTKRIGGSVVKRVYRAQVIKMPITKGTGMGSYAGHRRSNRKYTSVKVVSYVDGQKVKWKGNTRHGFRKQRWIGFVGYNASEQAWKFYDLRGSKYGRVYHF